MCESKHNYFHMVDILLCKETLEIIQMSNIEQLKTGGVYRLQPGLLNGGRWEMKKNVLTLL